MNEGRPLLGRGSALHERRAAAMAPRTGRQQLDQRGILTPFDYDHAKLVARLLVESVGLTPERVRELVDSRPKTESLGEPERT